jgi:siroheme decarboxylase
MRREQEAIASIVQGDLPAGPRPFARVAALAGVTEAEVLATLRELLAAGTIRRFGAVLRHRAAGITANAMVVWAVPPERREDVGEALARFAEVSHCYERTPPFAGRYGLFTMVHAPEGSLPAVVARLQEAAGSADCLVLESVEEFKKESMEYFP